MLYESKGSKRLYTHVYERVDQLKLVLTNVGQIGIKTPGIELCILVFFI